ncbi:MAG: alpha/beta hydrolase family protein [Planctomycetota bacterium]|nr:alpha/beta hydrolase family protein [Planctomycetota bacterium]
MSFIQASFFSGVLQKCVQMNVILPDKGNGPFPVFYLLHGLSDDYTIWHRRTSIERYVENLPLIVVMPDGYRGFYTDASEGPAYGWSMVHDVIGYTERVFPAVRKRSGRCVGGLSMGGYGALRLALAHPDLFVSANSHSGACQAGHKTDPVINDPEFRRIFGVHPRGSAHDLYALAAKLKRRGKRIPHLRIDCGLDDFLLHANRDFHAYLVKLGIPHEYAEFPGAHTWDYWDVHVREALVFHSRALGLA